MPTLAVQALDVVEYPPLGGGYVSSRHLHPTWERIEAAVRALDHSRFPHLELRLRERTTDAAFFSVVGGPNGYALSSDAGDAGFVQYCDPTHTGGRVDVWTSDQGYYPEERFVCYELELVLRLTRFYAEHGRLDPSALWEP